MITLGIETSCDETALAIVEIKSSTEVRVLGEVLSSQIELHQMYGGVVPELASREHLKALPLLFDGVLKASKLSPLDIHAISVTKGPGLKGCLLTGLDFAKGLSQGLSVPFIGVNHIEAHMLSPLLEDEKPSFPYLSLVVSGGHTELSIVRSIGDYRLLSRTGDDAAGEAFDKSANLLGLPYPGGPNLSKLAAPYSGKKFNLPKVMREAKGFSFSGLKTAISLLVKEHSEALAGDIELRGELAAAIETSIVDAITYKVKEAISEAGIKNLGVSGGVAANTRLRKELNINGVRTYFARPSYCTDNGVMIAYAGGLRLLKGESSPLTVTVNPSWRVEDL